MPTILEQAVRERAFPCAVWRVYREDELVIEEKVGTLTYESDEPVNFETRFDLASVSKPFTSFAVLLLASRGLISLDDPVSRYLEEMDTPEKRSITVRQCLLHTAGFVFNPELHKQYSTHRELYDILFSHPLASRPGTQVAYTSIGYQVLGYLVEKVARTDLASFMKKEIFEPFGLRVIGFNPEDRTGICPTEYSEFRGRLLVGEVHDDNAYVLGGVCGHTGLFADVEDVCAFGRMLLGDANPLAEPYRRGLFSNQTAGMNQSRSCAFVVNDPEFGEWDWDAFSHTGFTGTSIFLVPELRLVSVLLTNRVYPTRANEKIREVRRRLHSWLHAHIKGNVR